MAFTEVPGGTGGDVAQLTRSDATAGLTVGDTPLDGVPMMDRENKSFAWGGAPVVIATIPIPTDRSAQMLLRILDVDVTAGIRSIAMLFIGANNAAGVAAVVGTSMFVSVNDGLTVSYAVAAVGATVEVSATIIAGGAGGDTIRTTVSWEMLTHQP